MTQTSWSVLGAVVVLVLGGAGCSTTPCDEALDKAQECGQTDLELNDAGEECGTFVACQAQCVVDGSCNDLNELVTNPFAESELSACMNACGE